MDLIIAFLAVGGPALAYLLISSWSRESDRQAEDELKLALQQYQAALRRKS